MYQNYLFFCVKKMTIDMKMLAEKWQKKWKESGV